MKNDALKIINAALKAADPYANVYNELRNMYCKSEVTVISVGKAACSMAKAAYDVLGSKIKQGFVLTKYSHAVDMPDIFTVREAGHPVPDQNSVDYTSEIVEAAVKLTENDKIIFLLSGGGSALFEIPIISLENLQKITSYLLRSGADITEINALRKGLSKVKGGKFAMMCRCHIDCFILSDVPGDRPDLIASGPCCDDLSDRSEPINVMIKYFDYDTDEMQTIKQKLCANISGKRVDNSSVCIVGNVDSLCSGAAIAAEKLGYKSIIVTSSLIGEAREQAKKIIADALIFKSKPHEPTAFIYGGETTVTVKGNGMGGRNQEAALTAAIELRGKKDILFFALGSDGTDGPTDAAGGFADCHTFGKMLAENIEPQDYLDNNDSYNALKAAGDLLVTGPTGTNVNDIFVVLIK